MNRRDAPVLAIACGALTYVTIAFLRTEGLRYLSANLADHWLSLIDAFLVYAATLLSGFVAARLYRKRVFMTGFFAAAVGELARGLLKLSLKLHAVGWMSAISLPLSYVLDIVFAAAISGILGAAGAAVAVVASGHRAADQGSTPS